MVCKVFIWFFVLSVAGWVWESAYCTVHEHGWRNRGFLFGPLCPIYGVAALAIIFSISLIEQATGVTLEGWQVFALSAVTSAVVEYVTSYAMERLFHARWWDYSDMPLNVNGRICMPATVLFGFGGLACRLWVAPWLLSLNSGLSLFSCEALAMLGASCVSADTAVTVSGITQFAEVATSVNDALNDHMDRFVAEAFERGDNAAAAIAAERERVGEELRASRLAQMSESARAAASRMLTVRPGLPDGAQTSEASGLHELLQALRRHMRASGEGS